MKKRMTFFFLVIWVLSTGVVFAEAVGKLSLEKGIFKLRRNNVDTVYREPGSEIEVYNRDEIQTAGSSLAKIRLYQNSDEIEVFSNSLFIMSNISQESSEILMPVGKSRFLIKPRQVVKKTRKRFRIKTTNALIVVKGTDFIVGVHNGNTSLLTLDGVVSLSNINEPEVEVNVRLNQASQIRQNKRPTAPTVVSPRAREAIIAADTPAAFKSAIFGAEVAPIKTDKNMKKGGNKQKGERKSEGGEAQEQKADDVGAVDEDDDEDLDTSEDELDDILAEVEEIIEEVVEEIETAASEVEVIIEITE